LIGFGYICGLLTKCEVKMAGYWPSFACLWTETELRSINTEKKPRVANNSAGFGSYCPLTELAIIILNVVKAF